MSAILTVPSGFVVALRAGLYGELAEAGEVIAAVADNSAAEAHEEYGELRETFNAVCGLLDAIGWGDDPSQGDVALDLADHPAIVLSALRHEHDQMTGRLGQLPKRTAKATRERAAERAAAFGDFVKGVETQAARLPAGPRKEPARRFAPVSAIRTPRRGAAAGERLRG
jgi:hypothetical protein